MANYKLGDLVWKITGDNSHLDKSLKDSDKNVKKTGKGFGKLGMMAKAGLAVAGVAAVAYGKKLLGMASAAEEVDNKFRVVFKDVKKEADSMAENLANNYGLARTEAKKLMSNTGDILIGFGFASDSALNMANSVNTLAADLGSFNNLPTEDVSRRITAALTGETDGLKALGVVVNQSDKAFQSLVKRKMQDEGITLQQAKAGAILNEIQKQSTNAIGDFARSQGSFANQSKILFANLQNIGEEIGKEMLPGFTKLVSAIVEATSQGGFLLSMFKGVGQYVGFLAKGVANLVIIIGGVSKAMNVNKSKKDFDDLKVLADDVGKKFFKLKKEMDENPLRMTDPNAVAELDRLKERHRQLTQQMLAASGDLTKKSNDLVNSFSKMKEEADKNAKANVKNADKSKSSFKKFQNQINGTKGAMKGLSDTALEMSGDVVTAVEDSTRSFEEMAENLSSVFDSVGGQFTGLFGALQQLSQAQTDARINDLQMQLQAELEAAGVAEETAVQKAQRELDIAKQEGDQELIQEKQKLLKRAQIEEEYAKKMRKLEYQGALASWQFQKAIAIVEAARAPLAAFVATMKLGPIAAGAAAAAAAVTAGIQLAAVEASKPQKPKFQDGGIVPGGNAQMVGDTVDIRANAGEAVITQSQQARLLDLADGGQANTMNVRVVGGVTFDKFLDELFDASADGRLLIADQAVTSRY